MWWHQNHYKRPILNRPVCVGGTFDTTYTFFFAAIFEKYFYADTKIDVRYLHSGFYVNINKVATGLHAFFIIYDTFLHYFNHADINPNNYFAFGLND